MPAICGLFALKGNKNKWRGFTLIRENISTIRIPILMKLILQTLPTT